jgi:hypothetical protein
MDYGLVLLGFIGIVLLFAVLHVVSKMAGRRETAARRKQNSIQPFTGDTITHMGHS